MDDVAHLYQIHAAAYDRARDRSGMEAAYLRRLVDGLPPGPATVLDLGCGAGAPIAEWLVAVGCLVTGVDAAPAMLALARARLPAATWIEHDMRSLALGARFAAIVAWDSFFHLRRAAQRGMFPVLRDHLVVGGLLLFTSGHADGEAIGQVNGARPGAGRPAPERHPQRGPQPRAPAGRRHRHRALGRHAASGRSASAAGV